MNNLINLGLTIGQEQEEYEETIHLLTSSPTWNFNFKTIKLSPQISFPIAAILKILKSFNYPTINQLKEILMSNNLDCIIKTLVEFSDINSNVVIDKLNKLAIYDIGAKALSEKMKISNLYELFGFITTNYNITEHNILYNDCFCYSEKPAAARPYLAVPTPVVSVSTTPVLLTRLVIETLPPVNPYPNIALSVP